MAFSRILRRFVSIEIEATNQSHEPDRTQWIIVSDCRSGSEYEDVAGPPDPGRVLHDHLRGHVVMPINLSDHDRIDAAVPRAFQVTPRPRYLTCLSRRKVLDSSQTTEHLIRRRAIGRQNEDVDLDYRLRPLEARIDAHTA